MSAWRIGTREVLFKCGGCDQVHRDVRVLVGLYQGDSPGGDNPDIEVDLHFEDARDLAAALIGHADEIEDELRAG